MSDQPPIDVAAAPGALGEALARFVETAPAPAPRPHAPRTVREAALAFVVAALVAVTLDAEGLLSWAQRLEVGTLQSLVLAVVRPVSEAVGAVGLGAPRRLLARAGDDVSRLFGAEVDAVLAVGWVPPEPHAAAVVTPEPVAGVPAPAPVEEPGDGAVPLVPPVERALAPERPTPPEDLGELAPMPVGEPAFLLLGDSMIAGSLGTSLREALERGGRWRVAHAYQLGTGLARPDVYDWMKVVPPLLERERPRFVVVALGGNDGTPIREGDEVIDFGTARWRQVYAARVEAMMRALATNDTRVLWLGLPPMRDARLGRRAAFLNGIFASHARRVPGVEFLQLDMLVSSGDGQYTTFVQGPDGRLVRYRLDDGVHLAPAGSRAIARWVMDWVRERSR